MSDKKAIIIGAGPAGLTAAYELLERTDVKPIIVEKSDVIGGLSRTYEYKGNKLDVGPHRFFSKSDRVMDWWTSKIPIAGGEDETITYHNKQRQVKGQDLKPEDNKMILLKRRTRIYYLRKFFDYPISLKVATFTNLGLVKTMRIGFSYINSVCFPIKKENSLEDFITNRFGRELYLTFFKDYTEKVWGIDCNKISAAWGAQRIKGLSIMKAVWHAFKKIFAGIGDVKQKGTETSLVEQFLYPEQGTGSMWELVADRVKARGGVILLDKDVESIKINDATKQITALEVKDAKTGETTLLEGDYFFSSMPVRELISKFDTKVPPSVKEVSDGLVYRDFIEVGLLVKKLKITDELSNGRFIIADNWIYVQENDVLIGRLQIYNNWGRHMVADPDNTVWLGLEYFCNDTDDIWTWSDDRLKELGAMELDKIGIINKDDVLDAMVIRMPKTYPGYFGTYDRFQEIQDYVSTYDNLFLVGRNGMHKYNNQDHSMLTAMVCVDNIASGIKTKENIWDVNTEMEYHEEKNA